MAEEILIEVSLDKAQAQKDLDAIAVSKQRLKEEQQGLNAAYKAGKISQADFAKQTARLKTQTKELSTQERELGKVLQAEAGSIDALKVQLAELTRQRNATNQSTAEGVRQASQLDASIKSLNDRISKNEQAGGDFRRNVGAYSDGFKNAVTQTGFFNTELGRVVSQGSNAIRTMTNLTNGVRTFKTVLASTGIGLIVLALGSLVAMFQSSEEGQGRLNKVMEQFGVIIGNASDLVGDFGDILFSVFTGQFDEIPGKFEKLKEGVSGFVEETSIELELAREVADLTLATNRLERQLTVEQSKTEARVQELRLKARQEEAFSNEQRLEFLNEANRLQDQLLEKDEKIKQNRLVIARTENSFSKSTKENLDAEAQAEADLNKVVATRFSQARQIERERIQIVRAIAREEKANEQARAAALEERKRKTNDLTKLELAEEGLDIQARILEVEQGSKEELELQKKLVDNKLAITLVGLEGEKQAQINAQKEANNQKLALEKQFQERKAKEAEVAAKQKAKEEIEFNKSVTEDINEAIRQVNQDVQTSVERQITAEQQRLEQVRTVEEGRRALMAESLAVIAANTKEGTALQKAAAVATAGYQTYVAANQALANPPGPPFTIPFMLAAIVSGLANVKEILKLKMGGLVPISSNSLATNIVKAEKGTVLRGPSHALGGIPVMVRNKQVAEVEGGEVVLTRNVSKSPAFLALASTLNQLAGGRSLTTQKYIMATGGIIASARQAATRASQNKAINQLNETLTNKKFYVAVTDIRRAEKEMIDVEQKRTI